MIILQVITIYCYPLKHRIILKNYCKILKLLKYYDSSTGVTTIIFYINGIIRVINGITGSPRLELVPKVKYVTSNSLMEFLTALFQCFIKYDIMQFYVNVLNRVAAYYWQICNTFPVNSATNF